MKPALILQHLGTDGRACLGQWLAARGVPVDIVDSRAGAPHGCLRGGAGTSAAPRFHNPTTPFHMTESGRVAAQQKFVIRKNEIAHGGKQT